MAHKKHQPQTAKKMYRKGYTYGQIQSILHISRITMHRYFRQVGGITEDDTIAHLIAKQERRGV